VGERSGLWWKHWVRKVFWRQDAEFGWGVGVCGRSWRRGRHLGERRERDVWYVWWGGKGVALCGWRRGKGNGGGGGVGGSSGGGGGFGGTRASKICA
jgi:hypothetical protein